MQLRNGVKSVPNLKSRTGTFRAKKAKTKKRRPKTEERSTDPDILTTWSRNNASSPFLCLPQEIKNMIYNFIIEAQSLHMRSEPRHPYYRASFRNIICRAKQRYSKTGARPGWTPVHQAELREDEWETRHDYCTDTGKYRGRANDQRDSFKAGWKLPSLLLVCREIYAETRLIPYQKHTFIFSQPADFVEFLKALSPDQVAAVRSIHLAGLSQVVSDWEVFIEMMIGRLRGVMTIELQLRSLDYNDTVTVNDFRRLGKLSLGSATLIVRQGYARVASFAGTEAGRLVTEAEMWG